MATKKASGKAKKTTSTKKPAAKKAVKAEVKEAQAPAAAKEAKAPAVKEEAKVPAEATKAEAPAVKEEAEVPAEATKAEAPAVKEEAKAPAVKEEAEVPAETAPEAPKAVATPEAPKAEPAEAPKAEAPKSEVKNDADAPKGEASSEEIQGAEKKVSAKIVLKPNPDGSKLTPVVPRPMIQGNPYKPYVATVAEVIRETHNIVTLRLVIDDPEAMKNFTYEPGQVGQVSVFGVGESTFVINTPPSQKDYLQFSVMQAGEVTTAIHGLCKGDKVGVRAPLGRPFPFRDWKGKNVFFIGGGIGMAPIRTIMLHLLENKADYGKISLLYGGKSPQDLAYSYELEDWMARPDLDCPLTIDREAEGWKHKVGLIPNVLRELKPSPDNCIAVLCGPPIMIRFTLQALDELGFDHENVYTTLEKRMKCGIGICGRCGIGGKYVCLDGPVFSQKELDNLPPEL